MRFVLGKLLKFTLLLSLLAGPLALALMWFLSEIPDPIAALPASPAVAAWTPVGAAPRIPREAWLPWHRVADDSMSVVYPVTKLARVPWVREPGRVLYTSSYSGSSAIVRRDTKRNYLLSVVVSAAAVPWKHEPAGIASDTRIRRAMVPPVATVPFLRVFGREPIEVKIITAKTPWTRVTVHPLISSITSATTMLANMAAALPWSRTADFARPVKVRDAGVPWQNPAAASGLTVNGAGLPWSAASPGEQPATVSSATLPWTNDPKRPAPTSLPTAQVILKKTGKKVPTTGVSHP